MGKTTSLLLVGLLGIVLVATTGYAFIVKGNDGVLKLAHSQPTKHPVHQGIVKMKERLEELSDGTMTIDIYPGSQLGSEVQCIEQLQNGSLSMTKTSTAALEAFIPEMGVFGLPYLFRDEEHYWDVLEGEIGQRLLERGESKYLRGLCYYDAGSRNFYTKDRPIEKPEDLAKMKIRVMNSATAMDMVEAFGASPTPISFGELYSALAQGTVDGAENNLPSFTSNKHYEVCKHFSLDGHVRIPDLLMISTKSWNGLSEQQQGWLAQAAKESAEFERALWAEETAKARKVAEAEGVTIYEVDGSQFAAKVKPMLDNIDNESLKKLVSEIEAVQ